MEAKKINKPSIKERVTKKMKTRHKRNHLTRAETTFTKTTKKATTKRKIKNSSIPSWDYKAKYKHSQNRINKLKKSENLLKSDIVELNEKLRIEEENRTITDKEIAEVSTSIEETKVKLNNKIKENEMIKNNYLEQLKVEQKKNMMLENQYSVLQVNMKNKIEYLNEVKKERDDLKLLNKEVNEKLGKWNEKFLEEKTKYFTDLSKKNEEISKKNEEIGKINNKYQMEIVNVRKEYENKIREIQNSNNQNGNSLQKKHQLEMKALRESLEKKIEETVKKTEDRENKIRKDAQDREENLKKESNLNLQSNFENTRNLKSEYEKKIRDLELSNESKKRELKDNYSKNQEYYEKKVCDVEQKLLFQQKQNEVVTAQKIRLQETNNKLSEQLKHMQYLRHQDEDHRKRLHNKIMELKGNIRVFCRVRPIIPSEMGKQKKIVHIKFPEGNEALRMIESGQKDFKGDSLPPKVYNFKFDRTFNPRTTQEEAFYEIEQLVQSSLDGFNVCIFAYGQTGSGKTHTMEGPAKCDLRSDLMERGMIPRSVEKIFITAEFMKKRSWSFEVRASFMEIYNEKLRDLLDPKNSVKKMEIKHKSGETRVTNLSCPLVNSPQKVYTMLNVAKKNRATASTGCNERSSRSHSIFSLHIIGKNESTMQITRGNLHLIDLAGSERLSSSHSTGERLKEAQFINKSLSTLGNVMESLEKKSKSKKKVHVPYRDSKLTYYLQNSLGGNAKCLMFCQISPMIESLSESVNALRFASKVNSFEIGKAKKQFIKR